MDHVESNLALAPPVRADPTRSRVTGGGIWLLSLGKADLIEELRLGLLEEHRPDGMIEHRLLAREALPVANRGGDDRGGG